MNYPGMFLKVSSDDKGFYGDFAAYPKDVSVEVRGLKGVVKTREPYIAKVEGKTAFPWRVMVITEEDADLLCNDEGDAVAVVPTYFTSNRGMRAEPMAKEMAADLGIEFQANVPEWEYDEEARKAHDIEVAKQQKEDAKKRRETKALLRQKKLREKYKK